MPRYKKKPKTGKHYMYINGAYRQVVVGEEIEVQEIQIRNALDKFECLGPATSDAPKGPGKTPLRIVHKGFARWQVINQTTGKPIHDEWLTKEDAEALLEKEEPKANDDSGKPEDEGRQSE